jgi:hypothetical protein
LCDVGQRVIERAAGLAQRQCPDDDPLGVQTQDELLPPLALHPDQAVDADNAVGEEHVVDLQPHRGNRTDLDTRRGRRHRQHRDALVLLTGVCGSSHQHDVVGDVGVGDPGLLAVDPVAAVYRLGPAPQRGHIRT